MTTNLKLGDKITVAWPHDLLFGGRRWWQFVPTEITAFNGNVLYTTTGRHYAFDSEGVYWCRGHEGAAVDALKAAVALR